jgi:HK97 family phage portal protein
MQIQRYQRPNLFQRVRQGLQAFGRAIFPNYSGMGGTFSPQGWLRFILPGSNTDWPKKAGPLWLNSAVGCCLGWIMDNFPEPEAKVYRKQRQAKGQAKEEEQEEHALLDLLANPNPYYDGDSLWAATALSFVVCGNGYWLKVRGGLGRTVALYWLPHWMIWPEGDEGALISHYTYQVNGQRLPLKRDDVVHFRWGIDPFDPRRGLGRLWAVLREIVSDNEAASFTAAILENMAVPGLIISSGAPDFILSDEQVGEIKTRLSTEASGDDRGKPLVLDGMIKIDRASLTPEELALDKIRQVPEARICGALRLPPTVVGLSVGEKQRSYANNESDDRKAYRNCLVPLQKNFAKTVTRSFRGDLLGDDERFGFCYQDVEAMAEDVNLQAARTREDWKADLMLRSEVRALRGLDVDEARDQVFFSDVSVNTASAIAEATTPEETDEEPEDDDA